MLDRIHSSDDLKQLNTDELKILASEIREFLVGHVSKTGGHLAANLGVVELTIALFMEFDPSFDRIMWDVGHQSYVHKLLTGRAAGFDSMRSFGGMSGFPKVAESETDAFNSGHSSTSISVATGFAAAARLKNTNERAIAVIGDGAMTGGMAFEALDHAGSTRLPVIVILNDNGMSISKNVGGISKSLKRVRTTAKYFKLKENVKSTLDSIPLIGAPLKKMIGRFKKILRSLLLPSSVFEDFGFKYLGPVDGHDINSLLTVLKRAKEYNEPVLIHVHTKKGKGYLPAEKNPDFFHGVSSFDEKTGKPLKAQREDWSMHFGNKLCELAEEDEKIVAVTAAMPLGTGLSGFAEKYKNRFFDVAIAEQHAVTFSAAMAKSGLTPVVAIYSTFLQRAYDQIIHDVSLMGLHTVFCIDRCGPVGQDGETHQGVFDLAFMLQMPEMVIFSPSNRDDFDVMLKCAVCDINAPVTVRYPRGTVIERETKKLPPNKAELVKEGNDVLIAAVGTSLYDALKAAEILEQEGISVAVSDVRCVKPLDKEFFIKNAEGKKLVVTLEDGVLTGGFGQYFESEIERLVLKLAYPNEPIVQGTVEEIKKKYNLSPEAIADRIKAEIKD